MTIATRAGWWLVVLGVCFFGIFFKVVILVPSVASAVQNRTGIIALNGKGNPLQRKLTQGKGEIDQLPDLIKQAEQYRDQGRYAEAESLYKRALAIREKELGPDHPGTAAVLNNLATYYREQGKYGEAEPLFKRALAITKKAMGRDHPDAATLLDNYAALLRKINRGDEAAGLETRAAAIRAKANPKNQN